jgi:hypothetical protein
MTVGLGSGVCVGSGAGVSVGMADGVMVNAASAEAAIEVRAWAEAVAAAGELQASSNNASSPATKIKYFIFELRPYRWIRVSQTPDASRLLTGSDCNAGAIRFIHRA